MQKALCPEMPESTPTIKRRTAPYALGYQASRRGTVYLEKRNCGAIYPNYLPTAPACQQTAKPKPLDCSASADCIICSYHHLITCCQRESHAAAPWTTCIAPTFEW